MVQVQVNHNITGMCSHCRIAFVAQVAAPGQQLSVGDPGNAVPFGSGSKNSQHHKHNINACTPGPDSYTTSGTGDHEVKMSPYQTSDEVLYEPSLPRTMFAAAADTTRLTAYGNAIQAAVQQLLERTAAASPAPAGNTRTDDGAGQVHVLEARSQSGAMAIIAAKQHGVATVTCVNAHPVAAQVARRNAALSHVSDKVSFR